MEKQLAFLTIIEISCLKGKLNLSSLRLQLDSGWKIREGFFLDWAIYYAFLKSFVIFREVLKSISMSEGSFLAVLPLAALVVTALSCMDDFT